MIFRILVLSLIQFSFPEELELLVPMLISGFRVIGMIECQGIVRIGGAIRDIVADRSAGQFRYPYLSSRHSYEFNQKFPFHQFSHSIFNVLQTVSVD